MHLARLYNIINEWWHLNRNEAEEAYANGRMSSRHYRIYLFFWDWGTFHYSRNSAQDKLFSQAGNRAVKKSGRSDAMVNDSLYFSAGKEAVRKRINRVRHAMGLEPE